MNPNTKNEILKQLVWCSDHQATERFILGLSEHIAAIPQDFEELTASRRQEIERETIEGIDKLYKKEWEEQLARAVDREDFDRSIKAGYVEGVWSRLKEKYLAQLKGEDNE